LRGVCGDVVAAESGGARAAIRIVPGWTNSDADRDLFGIAPKGRSPCLRTTGLDRTSRNGTTDDTDKIRGFHPCHPWFYLSFYLAVILLSACKQPASVAP